MQKKFDFTVIDSLYESGYHGPRALDQPEFYWRSMLGALVPYRDSYFRPLGEEIAPKDAREGVDIEGVRCNYEGSRHHHELPMNLTSLRQFANHWDAVLPTISAIRENYCASRGRDGVVSTLDLWFISKLCQLLPAYLIRRRDDTIDPDDIPVVPSIIYRMSLGMHRIVHISLVKMMASGGDPGAACLEAGKYYHIAEGAGLLIGRNSVCAGPQAMVGQAYGAMIGPGARSPAESSADDPGFYRYCALFMKLEAEKYMFAVQAAIQLNGLIDALKDLPDSPRAQPFREELLRFESWSAANTSPLAHEIAREDLPMLLQGDRDACDAASQLPAGAVRERMLAGLAHIVETADQLCRANLGAEGDSLLARIDELRNRPAQTGLSELGDLVGMGLERAAADLAMTALRTYRQSESAAMQIFQLLQNQLNQSLGYRDDALVFDERDIAAVFGPRLTHCYGDFFKPAFSRQDAEMTA
ncbi:hypothetical protein [Janthinobacterium agaricidamnosum]|uniref:Uncharacterized protein n=1 Tax=Janthinobacterium agaricidamnosum NBRC 102515 = DSM 9628 TaxID=1349767 RepID=W0V382_9BURK|nr:hypothetical protein [Janthinobacterium agaricidamnosum]CDG82040.1 putative uncharacterized protein [Janthinobacterium agaricidamnosum NBRC 102515 = DSM 9628]